MLWCRLRYGFSSNEYFKWGIYDMSWHKRRDFITNRLNRKLWAENSDDIHRIFTDKAEFMRLYQRFTKRDFLDMRKSSYEEFADFVRKHKKVFIKYVSDWGGRGAQLYEYSTDEELQAFYESLAKRRRRLSFIVEELVVQHPLMYSVGANSINTIRVSTYTWNNVPHVIACTLRMGGEDCTDNFTSGGSCAAVDIETGIVTTGAYRNKDDNWLRHPYTNTVVLGFQIPHWDKVIQICKEAALHMPGSVYVGWDVAILEDDVLLIEANSRQDFFQSADKIGKYGLIRRIKESRQK